ncbi:MAG: 50S ribosomal protein L32e [Methanoregula sp.]|nr:50S ribosomal protein L32e [Methanoregula sp.]
MTTEIKRLIRVRTDKGATFKRDGYGKKRQLSDSWRKPRGQHNKQREQKKAKGALPKPGFGSPVAVRGMHPSGFFEVLVFSVGELDGIDPKTHAIRLGATVGDRTRLGLQEKALAAGFKVLNPHTVKTEPEKEKVQKPAKIDDKKTKEEKIKEEKKPAKSKAPAESVAKDTKKAKKTPGAEEKKPPAEEKKSPVKAKKPAKPKAEPVEKPAEESKDKAPAKTTKKTAKPKTDAPAEDKPRAAPKSKAKKKTGSEVKKNE